MKLMSLVYKITYWVLLLAIFSSIKPLGLYAQGSYLDPERLEILARQGGYITSANFPQHMIYRSQRDSETFSAGDIVWLNIGSDQGIKPGTQLQAFRVGKLIVHPITEEKLGSLIKVVGELRITETEERTSTAIITDIYDNPVFKGDLVRPLTKGDAARKEAISGKKREKGVTGYIVAIKNEKQFASQGDIVYIDRGKADTITVGDTFNIYPFARLVSKTGSQVGQLRVISVQEKTSTAVISYSAREIAIGNIIVE